MQKDGKYTQIFLYRVINSMELDQFAQLRMKFLALYRARRFITVLKTFHNWSLS
jgi:hypothetical protein